MRPILVINDDASLLKEMVDVLVEGKFRYIAARTAKEALSETAGYDFSLVVMDLKLPDMDGDAFYDELLFREAHYELPVAALVDSMDGDEVGVVNRLLPRGRVTLLSKPLKKEWLVELFEQYGERK
ncbi:MAG: response regulator [Akkermansiaceae bacterium]